MAAIQPSQALIPKYIQRKVFQCQGGFPASTLRAETLRSSWEPWDSCVGKAIFHGVRYIHGKKFDRCAQPITVTTTQDLASQGLQFSFCGALLRGMCMAMGQATI